MNSVLMLLLFLLSCGETQAQLEERCNPVLQQILKTQESREIIRKDFRLTIEDYQAGRVSFQRWQKEKSVWLEQENKLATQVDKLYDYSYKTKCLQ